jgi:hypothetical protein
LACLLIVLGGLVAARAPSPAVLAAPPPAPREQSTFPNGTVVSLAGTPHLWIADESGVLHWGGDTRALQSHFVDWGNRVEVSVAALKALRRGDPYLSAGLLKDGEPIYLVKWEVNEAQPRLLHIQCIGDVELFGIDASNYGRFVIDRGEWERRFGISAANLQRAELAGADPTAASCAGRPKIKLTQSDVTSLAPALQRYGLSPSDVNVDRTVTFGLPLSVADPGQPPVAIMSAPLVRPATSTSADLTSNSRGTAVGVLKAGRDLMLPDGSSLSKDRAYLVVVRGAATVQQARMVYVPSGANPQELVTSSAPEVRQMSRNVGTPQTIMTSDSVCYSWNRVQVCAGPSPGASMTGSEQGRMSAVMNASLNRLENKGLLKIADINVGGAMPDVEGAGAVNNRRASMLAAPVNASAARQARLLDGVARAPLPSGASLPTSLPAGADVDVLVGALRVEETVDIPGYPTVPPGDYAVRAKSSGDTWIAELDGADGSRIALPAENVEVLGQASQPEIAVVNLAIISPPISLCFFREQCT